jgi:hypothetical protein
MMGRLVAAEVRCDGGIAIDVGRHVGARSVHLLQEQDHRRVVLPDLPHEPDDIP